MMLIALFVSHLFLIYYMWYSNKTFGIVIQTLNKVLNLQDQRKSINRQISNKLPKPDDRNIKGENRKGRTDEQKRLASLKRKQWWDKKRQEKKYPGAVPFKPPQDPNAPPPV